MPRLRPTSTTASVRRPAGAVGSALACAGALAMLLAGCVDSGSEPTASATASSSTASASATPTASASASPTPTATPATPITADCATLVPLQALYDLNPNFALLDDTAPSGALAIEAVAAGGVACTLVHTTSGERIEVAVSAPGTDALAAARASAGTALDLGIAGVDGFTSSAGVQAFTSVHRYSAESSSSDAETLAAVIAIPIDVLG